MTLTDPVVPGQYQTVFKQVDLRLLLSAVGYPGLRLVWIGVDAFAAVL
jgi:hypothetical protein